MFWENDCIDKAQSNIDYTLSTGLDFSQKKLCLILFDDDLLQEIKTSHTALIDFLEQPEVVRQLVDNIAQLTEEDCCDKMVFSHVHVAYVSCEVLTIGCLRIFAQLMSHPELLDKILTCLTVHPKKRRKSVSPTNTSGEDEEENKLASNGEVAPSENNVEQENEDPNVGKNRTNGGEDDLEVRDKDDSVDLGKSVDGNNGSNEEGEHDSDVRHNKDDLGVRNNGTAEKASETQGDNGTEKAEEKGEVNIKSEIPEQNGRDEEKDDLEGKDVTKIIPQKATLISKLIATIHSSAAPQLCSHIAQNIDSFSKLINLLVQNIDISGPFEIIGTFIKRTAVPEVRYEFCEILRKLDIVRQLIDVMTLSEIEDKQRNACQILCDIIVIGRQDLEAGQPVIDGLIVQTPQDTLSEQMESSEAVRLILDQMFSDDAKNSTAIVCGLKVLQQLLNDKPSEASFFAKTIDQTKEEFERYLINFHELLSNPPKQEPIKMTFGIIQKPLGYMRLEVINLIKALIKNNSPNIIRKLVELKTMKVIVDLFFDYPWNNLLHTQVEQILLLIITNCIKCSEFEALLQVMGKEVRSNDDSNPNTDYNEKSLPEDSSSDIDNSSSNTNKSDTHDTQESSLSATQHSQQDSISSPPSQELSQNSVSSPPSPSPQPASQSASAPQSPAQEEHQKRQDEQHKPEREQVHSNNHEQELEPSTNPNQQQEPHQEQQTLIEQQPQPIPTEQPLSKQFVPSRALLSQLLNECDLIGRLLLPNSSKNSNDTSIMTITANSSNGTNSNDDTNSSINNSTTSNNTNSSSSKNNNNIMSPLNSSKTTTSNNCAPNNTVRRNDEQANFGHIIKMINNIAVNHQFEIIRDHLEQMKDKRPGLFDRWTTFVNVDVAAFKEISFYVDSHVHPSNQISAYSQPQPDGRFPNIPYVARYEQNSTDNGSDAHVTPSSLSSSSSSSDDNDRRTNDESNQYFAYISFTMESVIPRINADVLPKMSKQNMS